MRIMPLNTVMCLSLSEATATWYRRTTFADWRQVHVNADRHRRVSARQAARRDQYIVGLIRLRGHQTHSAPAREIASRLQRIDRFKRVPGLAVVLRSASGEVSSRLFRGDNEALPPSVSAFSS